MEEATYPREVEKVIYEWQKILRDPEFTQEFGVHPLYVDEAVRSAFGPILLKKWIDGDVVDLDPNEAQILVNKCVFNASVKALVDRGYLNSCKDENGKEVYWLSTNARLIMGALMSLN